MLVLLFELPFTMSEIYLLLKFKLNLTDDSLCIIIMYKYAIIEFEFGQIYADVKYAALCITLT